MVQFGLGTEKNGLGGLDKNGNLKTVVNDPWTLGDLSDERAKYTSENVIEHHTVTAEEAADKYVEVLCVWTPVKAVKKVIVGNTEYKIVDKAPAAADEVQVEISPSDAKSIGFTFHTLAAGEMKFGYAYDNVVIPQEKLPTLIAKMQGISLEARARRIAIQYSQIAALQMKQDYGMDFESMIAEQAQAELQLEIDNEAVFMLRDNADEQAAAKAIGEFTWVDNPLAA